MANQFTELETLLDTARITNLIQYSARCHNVAGAMIEMGVYKGGSLDILSKFNPHKEWYGLDTFDGLPEISEHDLHMPGEFGGVDYAALAGYFRFVRHNVRLIKGEIQKTFSFFEGHQRFSFAHVDLDLYQSILFALDFLVPRMSEGGIIILDDYKFKSTPGCQLAIERFFDNPLNTAKYHGELTYADGKFIGQYIIFI